MAHCLVIKKPGDKQCGKEEVACLVAILRACTKKKDLCRGTKVHDDILKRGLLEYCVDALVTMYAKCGTLSKAKELFDMYKSLDVLTWTALIAGFAQKDQGQDALNYFEQMQQEGVPPNAVTYTCILKACATIQAVETGKRIHDEIAQQGLLEKDVMLGTALVHMYAKCGDLAKARRIFEELPIRNVISWNALIAEYVQRGQNEEALNCFEMMQCEGLSPNAVSLICILKAYGSMGVAWKGERIHHRIAKQGLLEDNIVLGNALLDMYAKCGSLANARRVLQELRMRDVISWNALMVGYVQLGKNVQALRCFQEMECEGLLPNAVTFACILKACGGIGALHMGEKIHDRVSKLGFLQSDIVLGNALIDMYCNCGALEKAQRVLEELLVRKVTSWTALIAGYVQHGQGAQALGLYNQMQHEGIFPNAVTFVCILKACGSVRAVDKGKEIHDEISAMGLLSDNTVLGNAVVEMYVEFGDLLKAQQVLAGLPIRDVIPWNALMAGYVEQGAHGQALNCFEEMKREGLSPDAVTLTCALKACGSIGAVDKGVEICNEVAKQGLLGKDIVLDNAVIDMYVKCGTIQRAREVVEVIPVRNVISWTILIAGYALQDEGTQALSCVEQMQREGLSPNSVTFTCLLKACGSTRAADKGESFHSQISEYGFLGKDTRLGIALVDMYVKCGDLAKAWQVFEELPVRNTVAWNVLITGCAQQAEGEQALSFFERMRHEGLSPDAVTFNCILQACGSIGAACIGEEVHDEIDRQGLLVNNIVLGNSLVDMYANFGAMAKAWQVLEELPARNVVSWNALIAGYAQQGECARVLTCLNVMHGEGFSPNAVTLTCILKACASIGAADEGEKIHDEITKRGHLRDDAMVGNALVDMYAKCGALTKARQVLEELPIQDALSWNAIIAGYTQQCEGAQVLSCLEEMQYVGVSPNAATFSCVLSSCSRLGFIEDAQLLFVNLSTKYGLNPDPRHYSCMVDVFGRAGYLDKARRVAEELPFFDSQGWSVLLGACGKWGDVNAGRWAFEHGVEVDKTYSREL